MTDDRPTRLCLIDGRTRTHRQACAQCQDKLAGQIRELVEFYALLEAELLPGSVVHDGSKHTKADAPLPCREGVLNARGPGGIVKLFTDAEMEIRDFFDLTWPAFRGDTGQTITGAAEFVLVWLDRCANDWGNIDEFARDVRKWHSDCRSLLGQRDDVFSPGRCPLLIEQPDGGAIECGGKLVVDAWGMGNVTCRSCKAFWEPKSWAILGGELIDPRTAGA